MKVRQKLMRILVPLLALSLLAATTTKLNQIQSPRPKLLTATTQPNPNPSPKQPN